MVLLSHPKTELETQKAALVLPDPRSVRRISNHTCQRPHPPPALAARSEQKISGSCSSTNIPLHGVPGGPGKTWLSGTPDRLKHREGSQLISIQEKSSEAGSRGPHLLPVLFQHSLVGHQQCSLSGTHPVTDTVISSSGSRADGLFEAVDFSGLYVQGILAAFPRDV